MSKRKKITITLCCVSAVVLIVLAFVIMYSGILIDSDGWVDAHYEDIVRNAKTVSVGSGFTVALQTDGSVVAAGRNDFGQCNVSEWYDIASISAGSRHTVGLRYDGTVVAVGDNSLGQSNVESWRHIIAIYAEGNFTVGLRSNGTVRVAGMSAQAQLNTFFWRNIVDITINGHVVGLRECGTAVSFGCNHVGEREVSEWQDIVAVDSGSDFTVGLKSDGTVVVAGVESLGVMEGDFINSWLDDINGWYDIVDISASDNFNVVGLKEDGTVVISGSRAEAWSEVYDWYDIVAISAGMTHVVGLKADGTVAMTKDVSWFYVDCWHDIVAISTGNSCITGVSSGGSIIRSTPDWHWGTNPDFSDWENIVAVSGDFALKSDGTVVTLQINLEERYENTADWRNIVAISTGSRYVVGLKADGSVVADELPSSNFLSRFGEEISGWYDIAGISAGNTYIIGFKKRMVPWWLRDTRFT